MRIVAQRVGEASVTVEGRVVGAIGRGLLVLAGVGPEDNDDDARWLAGKLARMRIFPDSGGKMNHSVADIGGEALVVSQFTLFASTAKGNRPSFAGAAPADLAERLYRLFAEELGRELGRPVPTGVFGADMEVALKNQGPVTLLMDSKRRE